MMNLWYPPADYNGIGILQVSSWTKYSFDEKQDSFFVVTQPLLLARSWMELGMTMEVAKIIEVCRVRGC